MTGYNVLHFVYESLNYSFQFLTIAMIFPFIVRYQNQKGK